MSLERLNASSTHTMIEALSIQFTVIGDDFLEATMPVDSRTVQPMGFLHGGASVALAETLGSVASTLICNLETETCFGLEINANHIKSVREGNVIGRVTPIHLGKSTHVWDIRIRNSRDQLLCISRLTVAVVPRKLPTVAT